MNRIAPMVLSLASFFVGCALTAQNIALHPKIDADAHPEFGAGGRVTIQAIDARSVQLIGYRGGVMKTGPITTKDDIAGTIAQTVSAGLSKRGYQIVSAGEPGRTLRFELQSLEYEVVQLPHSPGVAARAVIKVVARSGDRVYQQTYSKELLKPVHAAPSAGFNEELINRTLSVLLADILADKDLL